MIAVRNVYLDRKGLEIEVRSGALVVRAPDQSVRSIPLSMVENIVLGAGVVCNTAALSRCLRLGVEVVMLSRTGPPGIFSAIGGGNHVRRRLAQLRAASDAAFRVRYAQRTVETKLRYQAAFLLDAARRRPELGFEVRRAAERLNAAAYQARSSQLGSGVASLLGIEGAAAAQFFSAYRLLFADSLEFEGRNRRPPRDPVNAVLSLGYTLLHVEAVKAAVSCGLDPAIGFLHDPEPGRESLACDLVETERALIDELTWNVFRNRLVRIEHFRRQGDTCLMGKSGRRAFYEGVEPVLAKARGRLRRRSSFLARLVEARSAG